MSVKRSIRSERPEAVLFERSEFTDDSERRRLSSEADAALNFWLLFFQEKSNDKLSIQDLVLRVPALELGDDRLHLAHDGHIVPRAA